MRVLWIVVVFSLLLGAGSTVSPLVVQGQSLAGFNQDCGTYAFDGDLTKGRTDGMVVRVDHTQGCYRYKFMTIIGADREEMASNPGKERGWQTSLCQKAGREAAVGHFHYYRGIEIDGSTVKVSCTPYQGDD